ncbi:PilZ domain-containing protein [Aliibacillus thermotolerans]|uniref:PilZ domain-containing protein n=1 Tax=Aliibacillus thermotolerans TaxID=1834418 RepID=A0ABW0U3H3_9BACI|nr:PilZ domain-containing protein [Aliibacillus thermotolerans]MDA3128524.1 hypothetical protein [Aliibacillus thermotolerans]
MSRWGSQTYRRNEGFRLTFKEPIQASIILPKGKPLKEATLHVIDMSLEGAKIMTKWKLPNTEQAIKMRVRIYEKEMRLEGHIVWEKSTFQGYTYGVKLDADTYDVEELLEELKRYVRHDAIKLNNRRLTDGDLYKK